MVFNAMFLYSFLADSITRNGFFASARIFFTVVVLPLPVMPHTKRCLLRSRSLNPKGMLARGRLPSTTAPILILLSVERLANSGNLFSMRSSKSGTLSVGTVQSNPNSVELMREHSGFISVLSPRNLGMRRTSPVDFSGSNASIGSFSASGFDSSPLRHARIMFRAISVPPEYAIAVCQIPLFRPAFSRSMALSA